MYNFTPCTSHRGSCTESTWNRQIHPISPCQRQITPSFSPFKGIDILSLSLSTERERGNVCLSHILNVNKRREERWCLTISHSHCTEAPVVGVSLSSQPYHYFLFLRTKSFESGIKMCFLVPVWVKCAFGHNTLKEKLKRTYQSIASTYQRPNSCIWKTKKCLNYCHIVFFVTSFIAHTGKHQKNLYHR